MTLGPKDRRTTYDIVQPPAGWTFDAMAVCAYSASLETILSLPAALLADTPGFGKPAGGKLSSAQFAALKRTCSRTLIFCQEGALHGAELLPPAVIEAESMVHGVTAPGGGAFHPKVWVVRFQNAAGEHRLRLAITSRNLTGDRSWDAGVMMDGRTTGVRTPDALGDLLRALPGRCVRKLTKAQTTLLNELADGAERTRWTPPDNLGQLTLHLTGFGETWTPPPSDRLVVFSPFLHRKSLKQLAKTSDEPVIVVSRPEALDRTWNSASTHFSRQAVLAPPQDPAIETHPGELHAKIYAWDKGARRGLALGSMNATRPALDGESVEFMVQFDCTRLLKDGVAALVESLPLSAFIEDYAPLSGKETEGEPADDRPARRAISDLDLHIHCEAEGDEWRIALCAARRPTTADARLLAGLTFRPGTLSRTEASPCLDGLSRKGEAKFATPLVLSQVTGFIVFEAEAVSSFTLCLEVRGVADEDRRQAALRTLLPDEQSFRDFMRILLGDTTALEAEGSALGPQGAFGAGVSAMPSTGLLELMVRCAADNQERLQQVAEILGSFSEEELAQIAPPEFHTIWAALAPKRAT